MNNNERFEELWNDYLEGELDESGMADLQQLLASNESFPGTAANSFQTHRLLGLHVQESEERHEEFVRATMAKLPASEKDFVGGVMNVLPKTTGANAPVADASARWSPYLLMACLVALLMAAGYFANKVNWATPTNQETANQIASVTVLSGPVDWTGAGGIVRPITETKQGIEGGTLESLSADGSAELEFLDGSTLIVSGRSLLTLSDDGQKVVRLRYGNISADVASQPTGNPMLVHTPSAKLSVLGTQFNVEAQPETTKLVVNEGLVRLKRLADDKEVSVEARHEVTASIEGTSRLLPIERDGEVTTWTSDLRSDVVLGKWISELAHLARKLKKAVALGELSKAEASAKFKAAASLDEQRGSVWAMPESVGSLIVLRVARPLATPVILQPTSRLRIQGRTYGAPNVQFGLTVNDPNGGFFGKYRAAVSAETLQNEQENFDIVIPLDDFAAITTTGSCIGKELRDWWCVLDSKSAKLEITHVELMSSADEFGQDRQDEGPNRTE